MPYSEEYREFLEPAAKLLREAAALTTNATLQDFLNKRAAAFASNDYYDSDVAWMDLDSPIDVTIGPYETYEDELFGYKAAFEAYVTLRDEAETAKLKKFSALPAGAGKQSADRSEISQSEAGRGVADSRRQRCFQFGRRQQRRANGGLQSAERRTGREGKRLEAHHAEERAGREIQQDAVPISRVVLEPAQQRNLAFDSFFTHILMHELMHGLGPHNITVDGQRRRPCAYS